MYIKVVQSDEYALGWVRRNLPVVSEFGDEVRTLVVRAGGPKVAGIYSLPEDSMYWKGKAGKTKLGHSVYLPRHTKPSSWMLEEGLGRKSRNQGMRSVVQPAGLADCDVYLALNRNPRKAHITSNIVGNIVAATKVTIQASLAERGGAVVYSQLPHTRVVTATSIQLGEAKSVWYGTSGLYNLAELVITLKAACELGLQAKFDSYRYAVKATEEEALHEREGMRRFARLLQTAVGVKTRLVLGETATMVLGKVEDAHVGQLARTIQSATNHPTAFLHRPDGTGILTNAVSVELAKMTLRQLHEMGWWAGGSLIYWAFYAQSERHAFVAVVYDGAKGGVHRLAQPWMERGNLWVIPAGSYHITKTTPDPADAWKSLLGPWEFLRYAKAWGREKTVEILRTLWELARVPLPVEGIGVGYVAKVGLDGLEVEERRP